MTSGTRTLDGRYAVSSYCAVSPNNKVGFYYTKTWNGTNQTPEIPVYTIIYDPVKQRNVRIRIRTKRRRMDPHPYTCTVSNQLWGQWTVQSMCYSAGKCLPCNPVQTWVKTCCNHPTASDWGSSPWTSNDDLTLLSKIHQRVYGSDFNPAVFLAEFGQSLGLISESATKLASFALFAKRGEWSKAWRSLGSKGNVDEALRRYRRRLSPTRRKEFDRSNPELAYGSAPGTKSAADLWATYRWGIVPLLADMQDGAEWLAHKLHAPVEYRLSSRRTAKKKVTVNSPGPGLRPGLCEWEVRKQLICYLKEPPHKATLDLNDAYSVAWELVPYSFVVDWAVPIGTYLQVRGLASTLKGTFVTTVKDSKKMSRYEGFTNSANTCKPLIMATVIDGRSEDFTLTRTVSTTLTIPRPTFKGFGKLLTWRHAIDALALTRQRMSTLSV